MVDALVY